MELAQVEDCQKRKTNKAPVAADKLHYLSLHDSGTLPQMNGAQSLNEWDGWKLKCFGRSFELHCQRFLWRPSQWEKTHTLDEATSSDCACGVLASLDHPESSVLTGSDRHSLLEHSLPVATALVEFWSRWTTLNLAFFSVQPQRKHKMILGSMIPVAPLEHSLPVASVLTGSDRHPVRTLTTGSERSSGVFPSLGHHQSCVLLTKTLAKTQDHPWVDVSQPSLRTLTTGSERSNRERPSLPVRTLFILIAPFFYTFWIPKSLPVVSVLRTPHWQNSQFTTGRERSKDSPLTEFPFTTGSERSKGSPLTKFPIHYR